MFEKILIANRGEIAVRVIQACRDLGVRTVAVHVPGEETSLHVTMADEVISLPDRKDYLNVARLIEATLESNANALHPGYGFLSENPDFAQACVDAGVIFIGPSAEAISKMGVKAGARQMALDAGVEVLPGTGTHGVIDDPIELAKRVGFPVLVKASYGGGGRGIRVAYTDAELLDALAAGAREAQMAFANGEVYIEKFLETPRHVEVQVLCDTHGNRVALGERECSIQRRRQKLIEEGPSPGIDAELRQRLNQAAVRVAEAIGYVGAGTVEFLVDAGRFYFMEMNTRIQVEHGVTELLTGVDLVSEQIRIAAGLPMDLRPRQGRSEGWAIECRIVAEDPARQFRPSPGQITHLHVPHGPWVRWDSYLYSGAKVSPMFDSLVGKLLAWGRDRQEAIARMKRALNELRIDGITTTIPLMRVVMDDPVFVAGGTSVRYLEDRLDTLLSSLAQTTSMETVK